MSLDRCTWCCSAVAGSAREASRKADDPRARSNGQRDRHDRLNGDGTPDLFIAWTRADGQGRYLQILIGEHAGADFSDETASLLPQHANRLTPIVSMTPVDLDGDGDMDIASVLRNGAAGGPIYRNVDHGRLKPLPASFSDSAGGSTRSSITREQGNAICS